MWTADNRPDPVAAAIAGLTAKIGRRSGHTEGMEHIIAGLTNCRRLSQDVENQRLHGCRFTQIRIHPVDGTKID